MQDDEPAIRIPTQRFTPASLDAVSVAELQAYIGALKAEIGRAEAEIVRKEAHRSSADAFFRKT